MFNSLLTTFPEAWYFLSSVGLRVVALVLMLSVVPLMIREARVRDNLRLVRYSLLTIGVAYAFVVVATGTYTWCLAQSCSPVLQSFRGVVALLNGLGMLLAAISLWLIYRRK
jgi:hypothetical protein